MGSLPDDLRDIVREWGEKAHQDLLDAQQLLNVRSYANAAFHAQQSAEKALKSVLVLHQHEYPYSHDIEEILKRISPLSPELAETCARAATLSPFAVTTRYPGKTVDLVQAERAVEIAERVYGSVRDYIATNGVAWP